MTLLACFHDLMAYLYLFVKREAPGQPSYEKMRQSIETMLLEAENKADRLDIPKEAFLKAEFAVCAWIDETLVSSQWENRYVWVAQLLQRDRYGISNAGELFFERLNGFGPEEKDVREVYLACLSFGFEGRYFGPAKLRERRDIRLRTIRDVYGSPQKSLPAVLFPESRPPMSQEKRNQRVFTFKKPLIASAVATAAVLLFGVVYSSLLGGRLDALMTFTLAGV